MNVSSRPPILQDSAKRLQAENPTWDTAQLCKDLLPGYRYYLGSPDLNTDEQRKRLNNIYVSCIDASDFMEARKIQRIIILLDTFR